MIPVDQTILHSDEPGSIPGNCFQACVASIFELPLEEVPHFVGDRGDEWYMGFADWLAEKYNMEPVVIPTGSNATFWAHGFYIATGESPRDHELSHACVYQDVELVHDPHPDNTGLASTRFTYTWAPLDPKFLKKSDRCDHCEFSIHRVYGDTSCSIQSYARRDEIPLCPDFEMRSVPLDMRTRFG